jgi:hypothetical protein
MSCPHAHDDAAYVLGALGPAERLALERHLSGCDECARSVRALAGLPGLLDRVDARVLEHPASYPPVPPTLLPALTREVGRSRRRRTVAIAGLAASVAAVAALGAPLVADHWEDPPPGAGSTVPSGAPSSVETLAMAPVGNVPVRATVDLEQVLWGTRILLTCSYDPDSVEYGVPEEADYVLFVRTRDGRTEQVGSWRSVGGTTMQVPAATSVARADIARVDVRTTDGRVVLRLRT